MLQCRGGKDRELATDWLASPKSRLELISVLLPCHVLRRQQFSFSPHPSSLRAITPHTSLPRQHGSLAYAQGLQAGGTAEKRNVWAHTVGRDADTPSCDNFCHGRAFRRAAKSYAPCRNATRKTSATSPKLGPAFLPRLGRGVALVGSATVWTQPPPCLQEARRGRL